MEQNLTLYKIFYETAKAGNISHAAKKLFITQPAISKAIRTSGAQSERVPLLRTSRGVLLTDEGKLLFSVCQPGNRFPLRRGDSPRAQQPAWRRSS